MTHVTQIPFPADSQLHPLLPRAHYWDAFTAELAGPTLTPSQIMLRVGQAFPDWAEALLDVRNRVVRRMGIRDVGRFRRFTADPSAPVTVGDPLGIFRVVASDERELVLGIDDAHLDVRICVLKRAAARRASYVLGSVVTIHNLLGRAYMLPVAPMHRLIVREMLRRAEA